MEDEAAVIYGLEFQARALTAQSAETEAIRFLVGTQSLRFDNQVHLIDFDDENNVINKSVFLHKSGEIWHISSSLRDREILATVYNKTSESQTELRASIWRLPAEYETERSDDPASSLPRLEPVAHFEAPDTGDYKRVLWQPSGETNEVITVTDNQLILWDLQVSETSVKQVSSTCVEGKGHPKLTTGAWSPHHNCTQVATANGTCVRGWDLRSMKQAFTIENAHGQLVRDLDFNPNKQYYVATCGDDCKAKFWDIRKASTPLKVLSDHSHWIWSVRYNHFHDQLVLTSSSDSRVVLTNAMSISSEPYGHLVEDEDGDQDKSGCGEPLKDGVVGTYEEHEDSVYSVAWSAADPWLFASLSYDGRLVINRVPRQTKYKILL